MIYFDNAATTYPKPISVIKAVNNAFSYYGANPGRGGHDMSLQTATQIYKVREKLCTLFGTDNTENVVFTQNCTHALNICIKGTLKRHDHVIISDLEHNSVLRPIHTMSRQSDVVYSIAKTDYDPQITVENYRKLINPRTKLIIATHASNVFGIKLPIEKLGALAKEKKVMFLVDAAQTAGIIPIDVTKMNIDFLCAAGHKSLYGPSGTGFVITPRGENILTIIEGGTGSASLDYSQPNIMPDKLESGTMNTVGVIGLGAGIDFINSRGMDEIYAFELKLIQTLYQRMSEYSHIELYTPYPEINEFAPVLSFNIKGKSSEETAAFLNKYSFALRGGFQCSPLAHEKMHTNNNGTARISMGAFNTMEEVNKFCQIIQN